MSKHSALPNFHRHLPAFTPPPRPLSIREQTAAAMQCPKCGRNLLITPSGYLCCEDFDCGKLLPNLPRINDGTRHERAVKIIDLRIAWPDRSIMRDKPIG